MNTQVNLGNALATKRRARLAKTRGQACAITRQQPAFYCLSLQCCLCPCEVGGTVLGHAPVSDMIRQHSAFCGLQISLLPAGKGPFEVASKELTCALILWGDIQHFPEKLSPPCIAFIQVPALLCLQCMTLLLLPPLAYILRITVHDTMLRWVANPAKRYL